VTLLKLSSIAKNINPELYRDVTVRYGFIFMVAVILGIVFWSLFRGIIMMDEAYYLLHFDPEVEPFALSNWFVLFKPFYIENLVQLRILMFSLKVFSAFFLGYSFSRFWGLGWPNWFTGLLVVFGDFVLSIPVQFVPNNSSLNLILIHLGMACLFMFYAALNEKKKSAYFFLLFSGVFFGFLPFVMVTNSPILLVVVVFLFFIGQQENRLKRLVAWTVGVFLAIAVFFVLLQDVNTFIAELERAINFQQFMDSHGLKPLVNWHIHLILKFLGIPLFLFLGYSLWKRQPSKSLNSKLILGIMGALVAYQLYMDITSPVGTFSTMLFYALLILMIYESRLGSFGWKKPFLLLLLLIPYFAALGTDVMFEVRSANYFAYILLLMLGLWDRVPVIDLKFAFTILMALVFLNFLTYPLRKGWAGYRMVKQYNEIELPRNKGKLFVDDGMVINLNKVSPHLSGKRNVVLSDVTTWGYLYLCDAKPFHMGFWPNESYALYLSEEKAVPFRELNFLENKNQPFSTALKEKILVENFEEIDMGFFKLYTKSNN